VRNKFTVEHRLPFQHRIQSVLSSVLGIRGYGWLLGFVFPVWAGLTTIAQPEVILLNVSFDPTREMYREINAEFAKVWKTQHGQDIVIRQSHGGSGKQTRSVMDGLPADVVTLALGHDIDVLAIHGKRLATNWQSRLPHRSSPFTSTIVFLVRPGNPKSIKDWDDLVRPDVAVITPNPKTSGGARWNYLAAYGYALEKHGRNEGKAREFISRLYRNVPVLDAGARGATTTFLKRGLGDVLITWESEAMLALKESGTESCAIVIPSMSILAEPPVSVVDKVVKRRGTEMAARAYLEFLYSETAQEIGAQHHFRPTSETVRQRYADRFPQLRLFPLEEYFGHWMEASAKHFGEDGVFDRMYFLGR